VRSVRFALSLVALAVVPARAHAQTKEECVAAFDRGQALREHAKLRAAREQFMECARDACSAPLRKDCAAQLEEVTRDLPTIVLGARDALGDELTGVRVWIDQEPAKIDQSGLSVQVDPGPHMVRFEDASGARVSLHAVLRMGEKNRPVIAVFTSRAATSALEAPPPSSTPSRTGIPPTPQAGPPFWAYLATGVGVVGLGVFTAFAISGHTEKERLVASCAPACDDAQVNGVKTRYIAADVSLGVGVVSLAIAAYLFLSQKAAAAPNPSVSGAL
jgi:hypothetical protein